jgi:GT2 family glycosyltransferase
MNAQRIGSPSERIDRARQDSEAKQTLTENGVSIVLGTYNRRSFLKTTIESVRKELTTCGFPHEIVVIDGGSSDATLPWLLKQKDVTLILQHNRGTWHGAPIERRSWGHFMNIAFRATCGKFICMISDDCLIVPGSLRNAFQLFQKLLTSGRKIGSMAFYWRNWPTGKNYFVGVTLGHTILLNHGLYLRSALEDVGFIDEKTFMFYCADGDLCLRLRAKGYECVDSKASYIEHFGHANPDARSENQKYAETDWLNYVEKWKGAYDLPEVSEQKIERAYEDLEMTYREFPRAVHRRLRFAAMASSLRRVRQIAISLLRHGDPNSRSR